MNLNIQMTIAVILLSGTSILGGLWLAKKKVQLHIEKLIAIGCGVLIALLFNEFLPHAFSTDNHLTPTIMMFGIFFIIIAEKFIAPKLNLINVHVHDHKGHNNAHCQVPGHAHVEQHQHHLISHKVTCSAIGCLIVCSFFDGFELASAFSINAHTGWLTTMALIVHVLPDGLLATSLALSTKFSEKSVRVVAMSIGSALLLGSGIAFAFSQIGLTQQYVLPFATGILIYVVMIHLLPVAIKQKDGLSYLVFAAVAVSLLFSLFAGHSHGHIH